MIEKKQKPLMVSFGATVAEKRKLLGMSQESLAESVGISQESLSRMEKGYIAPRFERLQAFANALGCSISDLFHVQGDASERGATITKILSSLSDDQQKEIIGIVATVVRLVSAR